MEQHLPTDLHVVKGHRSRLGRTLAPYLLILPGGGWLLLGVMVLSFLQWYLIGWVGQTLWQKDSDGKFFTIMIGPLAIFTTGLPTAPLNQPYSAAVFAGGSAATPFTWSLASGTMPAVMIPSVTAMTQKPRLTWISCRCTRRR